jgi:hypothetical protein
MLVSFLTTLELYLPVQVEGSRGDRTYEMESGAAIDQNVLGVSFGDDHTAIREQVTFAGKATAWMRTAESGNGLTFHFCPTGCRSENSLSHAEQNWERCKCLRSPERLGRLANCTSASPANVLEIELAELSELTASACSCSPFGQSRAPACYDMVSVAAADLGQGQGSANCYEGHEGIDWLATATAQYSNVFRGEAEA